MKRLLTALAALFLVSPLLLVSPATQAATYEFTGGGCFERRLTFATSGEQQPVPCETITARIVTPDDYVQGTLEFDFEGGLEGFFFELNDEVFGEFAAVPIGFLLQLPVGSGPGELALFVDFDECCSLLAFDDGNWEFGGDVRDAEGVGYFIAGNDGTVALVPVSPVSLPGTLTLLGLGLLARGRRAARRQALRLRRISHPWRSTFHPSAARGSPPRRPNRRRRAPSGWPGHRSGSGP